MIKAIETVYKGYRCRSRLEARWAVFFDAIKLEWMYEHEGFVLADNQLYLPDFWFPELNCFAEVKPKLLTMEEYIKCVMLPHPCILLDTQTPKSKHGYYCTSAYQETSFKNYLSDDPWMRILLEMSAHKKRLWMLLGENPDCYLFDDEAEHKAKSARFEFGENVL